MDITYLGHSSFKLKGKTATVLVDPYDPEMLGLKFPKQEADILTISHQHPDHNKAELVAGVKKIVDSPGEYEIMGVSLIGIPSFHDNKKGEERGKNIIFVYEIDGLRLAHLGDLGHTLSESTLEALGDIDIVMVPVGGGFTIGPSDAVTVVQQVEASIVIPMHYKVEGLKEEIGSKLQPVDDFLKEMGATAETLPKLSINKETLNEEEEKVVILERK